MVVDYSPLARPCKRCVERGLGEQCLDAEAKKRGRKKGDLPASPPFRLPGTPTTPKLPSNADAEYLQVLASSMLDRHHQQLQQQQQQQLQQPQSHHQHHQQSPVLPDSSGLTPTSQIPQSPGLRADHTPFHFTFVAHQLTCTHTPQTSLLCACAGRRAWVRSCVCVSLPCLICSFHMQTICLTCYLRMCCQKFSFLPLTHSWTLSCRTKTTIITTTTLTHTTTTTTTTLAVITTTATTLAITTTTTTTMSTYAQAVAVAVNKTV